MASENTPQNPPEPTPNPTPESTARGFLGFNIPPAIAKIVGGLLLVVLLLGLLSGGDCWFSVNSTCSDPPTIPPELILGAIVGLALTTFLGVPLAPAAIAGAGVWVVLQWLLPFAGN